ncbi:MAG: NAD(P)H-dependent glycerol-3-phosphate dehydrogenase [Aquabacterium sp.]
MRVSVLGAGAWGTALAIAASARHDVLLWTRRADHAQALRANGCNRQYLPDTALPSNIEVDSNLPFALAHAAAGLTVIASPMAGLRQHLASLPAGQPAVWVCKGFEQRSGALGHEIAREVRPGAAAGILSGPSFADEVARGLPTALVAASEDPSLAALAVQVFHGDLLRVYTSDDPIGVEVGGAVKNVLAIATGISDGLGFGLNTRAALITRGLAEMTRLGQALGAQPMTFMGLSGLGDLVLTATGDLSRNRRVGLAMATGRPLADILLALGHVAEGVLTAPVVVARAASMGVEMPITEAVSAILTGQIEPREAFRRLFSRDARPEV